MELNRTAEVSLHGQAADIEWTMEFIGRDHWSLNVKSVDWNDRQIEVKKHFNLTDAQASATLALFIGELEEHQELNAKLYEIAETVWKGVPNNIRMIP